MIYPTVVLMKLRRRKLAMEKKTIIMGGVRFPQGIVPGLLLIVAILEHLPPMPLLRAVPTSDGWMDASA